MYVLTFYFVILFLTRVVIIWIFPPAFFLFLNRDISSLELDYPEGHSDSGSDVPSDLPPNKMGPMTVPIFSTYSK